MDRVDSVPDGMRFRTVTREFDFGLMQDETLDDHSVPPVREARLAGAQPPRMVGAGRTGGGA